MIRVGLVDLCTSHPASFVPIIRQHFQDEIEVAAVWDGGGVRPQGYAQQFAKEKGIPAAPDRLEELVDMVDAGIVHSADWDLHVARARLFIEVGKPVLIDKPAVGNIADLNMLLELHAKHRTPVLAGSSVRYAFEIQELRQKADLGEVATVFASGPGDFFNYGIHTVEMMQGFLGAGVRRVRHIGTVGKTELFAAEYFRGPVAVFQLGAPKHGWHLTATTTTGVHSAEVDGSKLYLALLQEFVHMLRTRQPRVGLADSLEAIKVLLAAKEAQRTGRPTYLEDLGLDVRFDGHAFATEYAKGRR